MHPRVNSRFWCGTINNPKESESPRNWEGISYCVWQLEKGENGTEHWQLYFELMKKQRLSWIKKNISNRGHFEIRNGTAEQAIAYCSSEIYCKEHNVGKCECTSAVAKGRVDGPWIIGTPSKGNGERKDLKQFKKAVIDGQNWVDLMESHSEVMAKYGRFCKEYYALRKIQEYVPPVIELTWWQKEIEDILLNEKPKERVIIYIWSEESATGKTTFMKHIAGKMKERYLSVSSYKKSDIMCAYVDQKVIHFNMPRHVLEDEKLGVIYKVFEELSDGGLQFSGKYESGMKHVNAHIVVTSNSPPRHDLLPQRFVEYHVGPLPECPLPLG